MPIANCIVSSDCSLTADNLIEQWATASGQSPAHMSINIVIASTQFGKTYDIMANLLVPSLWSRSSITQLQTGLAQALSQCYKLPGDRVHIITSIVESGYVVEAGKEVHW